VTRFKPVASVSPLRVFAIVTLVILARLWTVTTHDLHTADEQDQQHDKIVSDGEDAWLSSLTH
jgi:hypothetical protein